MSSTTNPFSVADVSLLARVATAIERAPALRAGDSIIVGCSGGGDSTALLAALAKLGLGPLCAVYVNHGLRAGTDEEAGVVQESARRVEADFERVDVVVSRRGNVLAAARTARYEALLAIAHRRFARFVAVGHTATDQAETLVFHAARGAVRHSFAGIPERRQLDAYVTLIRPLLDVRRDETSSFAALSGLEVVSDPTNERMDFTRTRIRRALLARGDRDLDRRLGRLASAIAEWVERLDEQAVALGPLDALSVDAIVTAGPDVALRLLRRAGLHRAGLHHARALLSLASSTAGSRSIDLGDGLVAERRYGVVRIGARGPSDPGDVSVDVPGAGVYELLGQRVTVEVDAPSLDKKSFPWVMRNSRPGDRVRTRAGHRKLQDVFTDAKLPSADRRRVLLLTARGETLWVADFTGSAQLAIIPGITIRHTRSPSGNRHSIP